MKYATTNHSFSKKSVARNSADRPMNRFLPTLKVKEREHNAPKKRLLSAALIGLISAFAVSSASAVELLNLMVSKSGMQRISYEELAAAGADLRGLSARKLNVTLDGESVPTRIKGQAQGGARGLFGPGGFIEFYADSADSLYTNERAYTLHFLSQEELRQTRPIKIDSDRTRTDVTANQSVVYSHTEQVEQNTFYDFSAPSRTDPWHFGQNFSIFPTPTYNFELFDVVGGSNTAQINVQMYGLLDFDIDGNDHHYEVLVNDVILGDQQFDGNSVDTFSAENVVVNEGQNAFKYNYRAIAEVPFDIVALNKFQITYPRYTVAREDYLEGRFNSGHATVSGVQSSDFSVYRRLSENQIERLSTAVKSNGNIVFNASGAPADYIVVGKEGYRKPRVQNLLAEKDIQTGSAEYLIIAHKSLMGAELDELVALRSQNYAVKVVDVDQIYAQFGAHVPDSAPIYEYIKFAKENLDTRFVVFIGNDTYDYKKFQTQSVSLIPTRYITTPGGRLLVNQTPSDAAYGDLDNSGVPELPIGRISVRTKDELQAVVNKLKAYEARDGYAGRVLVAADKEDSGNGISFTQDAEALIAAMPQTWRDSIRSDFRAYPDVDGGQLAHEKTLAAINAGVSVVNFIGHSSHRRWSFSTPPMLRSNQISLLTNIGKPALVTQWGCWNSYFVDPAGNTMADEFLLAGENGAATVLGASTLTTSAEERALGVELNRRMYDQGVTIGEAVIQAKQALSKIEDFPAVQLGWQIIGDPALMVNP